MPSVARKHINYEIMPRFAKMFKPGDWILFVGVSRPFDDLYKSMFSRSLLETIDIKKTNPEPDMLGDISNCPEILDDFYAGVIMIGVYEYLKDRPGAFKEIYRILKPRGLALICVPGEGYYHDKPTVKPKDAESVIQPLRLKSMEITYYKSNIPNYIHLIGEKV